MLLDEIMSNHKEQVDSAYASVKKQDEQIYLITFKLNETRFAVPITQIREIVESIQITPFPVYNPLYQGIVNLHGHLVPVLNPQNIIQEEVLLKEESITRMIVCENLQNAMFILLGTQIKKVGASQEIVVPDNKVFSRVIKVNDEIMHLLDFKCTAANEVFLELNVDVA